MSARPAILLLFAVATEAKGFAVARHATPPANLRVRISGMGARNAEKTLRQALSESTPDCVLTCGFAGGLHPRWNIGDLLYDADDSFPLSKELDATTAIPAKFHCSDRILVHTNEKSDLHRNSGADAVEMESGIIRSICHDAAIPSATLRAISDTADESLPLDFNQCLDTRGRVRVLQLGLALIRSPSAVRGLLRLQRNARRAAERLGTALTEIVTGIG